MAKEELKVGNRVITEFEKFRNNLTVIVIDSVEAILLFHLTDILKRISARFWNQGIQEAFENYRDTSVGFVVPTRGLCSIMLLY